MVGPMAEWEASQRGGGRREAEPWFYLEPRKDMYVGVPLDYKEEPALLEILDSPRLVQAAEAAMVPEEWDDGYVTCGLPGGRAVPVYPDEDGYCSWVRIMLLALLQVAQVLNNSQGRQPDDVRTPLSQSIIPLPHTDGVAVGGDAS